MNDAKVHSRQDSQVGRNEKGPTVIREDPIMLARYYEAGIARFVSTDPAAASSRPKAPQTWNRYAYARNNPLLNVDRDGQMDDSFLSDFRKQGAWANVPPMSAAAKQEIWASIENGAKAVGRVADVAAVGLLAASALQPEIAPATLPAAGAASIVGAVATAVALVANPGDTSNQAALGAHVLGAAAGAATALTIKTVAPAVAPAAAKAVVAATEEVVETATEPAVKVTIETVKPEPNKK